MTHKFVPLVLLALLLTITDAGLIPAVEVLQGPSSRTTLIGPDGSTLSATAPGGTVVTGSQGTGLVVGSPLALAAGPEIVIAGSAGSIVTSYTLPGPAVIPAAISSGVESVPAIVASPLAANSLLLGDSENNDGAYVPDNTEQLYDDGSYKEDH